MNISVLTMIIVLVPMLYLLLASPAFLMVKLDIPTVARLFRAMFYGYFVVLLCIEIVAAALNVLDGHYMQAMVMVALAAVLLIWRRWLMGRIDAVVAQILTGLDGGARRLRRLHWMGMGANALQIATYVALVSSLATLA
jgi:hypothetical protein